MPKTNRIDTRLNLINEINNIEEPDGLSELSEQITRLRDDGTMLDLKTTQELISLYITCGQGLRDKVQELGKRSRYSETKNMYMRLMKKLSKDYSSLLNYEKYLKNTTEPKELDIEGFFEKARTRTISLNGQSLDEQKQVGAGQSVRYLVTVPLKDEPVPEKLGLRENDTFTAYFTENNEYDGEQVVYESDEEARDAVLLQVETDTIKTTVANFPVLRNQIRMPYDGDEHSDIYKFFMNQVPAHYRNAIHRNPERLLTDIDINRIYSDFEDIALDKNNEGMRAFLRNFHNRDAEDRKAAITGLIEYASTLYKASTALDLKQGLGINYFKSTGQRNALMSSVAGLFGCDEVIAFSEKINIKSFENGVEKTRKGVIMMPAEGEDPIHAGLNSNMAKLDRSKMENSPGLNNKIAKLQFLDYICGNPDRHQGNIFYQFSDDGKLIGVQGIDNDASFGSNKDFYQYEFHSRRGGKQTIKLGNAVRFEDLKLIPESMATTVMNLDPETYAFQLYGYGLKTAEVEGAFRRLIDLKKQLSTCLDHYKNRAEGDLDPDVPRIVPDDRMDQYSANEQLATHYKKELDAETKRIIETKGIGRAEKNRQLQVLQQTSRNDNIFGSIVNFGDQKQNMILQMNDSIDYICKNSYAYEKAFYEKGKGSFRNTLDEMEQTKATLGKKDVAFSAMFDALHALMDYDNHEIRGPLIKKSEGTFVRKDKDDHESVPEYRFVDEPLNKFDLEAFYSLNKEPEDDQSITNSMDEDDNVIHTSVIKEEASDDNEIITTHKAGNRFDDNEIITTTTRKKDVGEIKIQEDSDKDLTPEELSKKYSTLPESIQTIPKSDTYKKLNEALDQVYEYLSDSAALKVMEEYQTIQFCLSDPAYAKDRAQLKADLAKLKNSDDYKKYELARTMRDRLTEQLERYVKVKEECGELRKAAVRVSGMTKAEYDPYEGSALQENARQKVQDAQKATEKLNQSAPGQARKPTGPSI